MTSMRIGLASAVVVVLMVPAAGVDANEVASEAPYRPGAPGAGDRYFPKDGNGGYDVARYTLALRYRPSSDRLGGTATIEAEATQNLSRFHLDLDGLRVRGVEVDGRPARWRHRGGELVIDPAGPGLRSGRPFTVDVEYGGVPETLDDAFGLGGVFHTDDGFVIAGQPHGAATWFPANDHPTDPAAFTFHITAPAGLKVLANGMLASVSRQGRWKTWTWNAEEPMATYLATVAVGDFELDHYEQDGITYWDGVDPDNLDVVVQPHSGRRFALSGQDDSSYKRLSRTVAVPRRGARLSFWTKYFTDPGADFLLVEARPVGTRRWTTLRDLRGHTSQDTGYDCVNLLRDHPFLRHYQAPRRDGTCVPDGTTGTWHAATFRSKGWERWVVSLDRYAGQRVQVAITQVSGPLFQGHGAFVDDIRISTGAGTTSFERDGSPWDGWAASRAPHGSPRSEDTWIVGTAADAPPGFQPVAERAFAKQPTMIDLLQGAFGPYPFRAAGGIFDKEPRLFFALETQTRPVYGWVFFFDQTEADVTVVHELAHMWFGNAVRLKRWRHIWLNEGPTTYAEWLWLEHTGERTAEESFRLQYRLNPAASPFWKASMVDPGPRHLFDPNIYLRGAMVLHALRTRVGDETFFAILREWTTRYAGRAATTTRFIAVAEQVSGRNLDRVFETWLYGKRKPALPRAHQR